MNNPTENCNFHENILLQIKDLRNVFEESVSNAEARLEKLLAQLET